MTYFQLLKQEINKPEVDTPEKLENILHHFRYELFQCEVTEACYLERYDCVSCYREWIMTEIN